MVSSLYEGWYIVSLLVQLVHIYALRKFESSQTISGSLAAKVLPLITVLQMLNCWLFRKASSEVLDAPEFLSSSDFLPPLASLSHLDLLLTLLSVLYLALHFF